LRNDGGKIGNRTSRKKIKGKRNGAFGAKREKDGAERARALEKRRRSLYNKKNFGLGEAFASASARK
jgi:hypothetical protein